jgi:hypothetical protein
MRLNLVGPFKVNAPFGTEIAFSKGLRQLLPGLVVTEVDPNLGPMQLDWDATATIVFKSCCGREDELRQLTGPVIVYQPDDARFPHIMGMMLMMRKYSELFLSFDRHGTKIAKNMGYSVAEELLLTADPELYSAEPAAIQRDIDISFIGSLGDNIAHASRRKMCRIVESEAAQRGWKFVYAQCQDIPTVTDIYRRSKIVLNHATDVGQKFGFGFGLQCRHFEVGMTRTCLLSNRRLGFKEDELETMPFITFDDEYSLISQIKYLLETGDWEKHGQHLYEHIVEHHMPIHRAGQMINFVQRHVIG